MKEISEEYQECVNMHACAGAKSDRVSVAPQVCKGVRATKCPKLWSLFRQTQHQHISSPSGQTSHGYSALIQLLKCLRLGVLFFKNTALYDSCKYLGCRLLNANIWDPEPCWFFKCRPANQRLKATEHLVPRTGTSNILTSVWLHSFQSHLSSGISFPGPD